MNKKKKKESEFFTETVLEESDYVTPVSDITREKIRLANIGKKQSDLTRQKRSALLTKSHSEVIAKFREVHGDKYDY